MGCEGDKKRSSVCREDMVHDCDYNHNVHTADAPGAHFSLLQLLGELRHRLSNSCTLAKPTIIYIYTF